MPGVRIRESEHFDAALRRFKRACEKAGVLTELRRREFYEKPTQERKRKKAAAVKKEPAKRKSRAKSAKVVRMKAFWGVFNQSLKRVALYEFSEKKEADKKAKELTASGKSPHFVQPVKEAVQE